MADTSASSLLNIYKIGTGRRLHAQREVERRAKECGATEIAGHAETAVAHDTQVAALETKAAAGSRNRYGQGAVALDKRVDSMLMGIEAHLQAQERVYGGDSERGKDAAFVRQELLPEGAGAMIKLPFVPEHERVNALIARARDAEMSPVMARIPELSAMLTKLDTLNIEYGKLLVAYDRDAPSAQEVLAAQARGQELLAEVVAMIIARYALLPDKRVEREALLEPILRQNEQVRLARLRRRRPGDIDPDTGVELPEPPDAEPGDGDGPITGA